MQKLKQMSITTLLHRLQISSNLERRVRLLSDLVDGNSRRVLGEGECPLLAVDLEDTLRRNKGQSWALSLGYREEL